MHFADIKKDVSADRYTWTKAGEAAQVRLFDLMGRVVSEVAVTDAEASLSVTELPAGVYIATWIGNNNEVLANQKITVVK